MIEGLESRGAWACAACGGVWAGMGVSSRVVSILEPAVRELADVAERHASTAKSQAKPARMRSCPDCRAQLTVRALGAVFVDVCREHGTWFDQGELQRVADERLGKKPKPPDEEGPASARWKPDTGTELAADVAIGALGLFFEILSD